MKSLDRSFIDDLLSRIDIVEIINQSVQLKKHGAGYKGLCPFHAENTPSFNVSSTKQFYHCFGCGASGDVIKFLRENDGLTFMEAIEKLASLANVEIPKTGNYHKNNNQLLVEINNFAMELYFKNLKNNDEAKKYLTNRNIDEEMIEYFKIGLAVNSWDNLTKILKDKGKIKEGIDLGLLVKNGDKLYDRFRNRIMFPIKNTSGKVIAFGGRALSNDDNAKYINSPESELFHKSSEVYGLHESKSYIGKKDGIVIVEGYTDVIALHKNGFNNAVAALGTAFTKQHVAKLLRYSKNIIFCFDGDQAGKNAAWKALVNCLPEIRDGVKIGFSFLKDGTDPDEICNNNPKEFQDILSKKKNLSEFMIEKLSNNLDFSKVEDKTIFINTINPLINYIPNGVFKNLLKDEITKSVGIKKSFLSEDPQLADKNKINSNIENTINASDLMILQIFLEHPKLIKEFKDVIVPIIKNDNIKSMLEKLPEMQVGGIFHLNKFLDEEDEIKAIFIKYSSDKKVYKNEESATKTINNIILNEERNSKELEYFSILKSFTEGNILSSEEKEILKKFKK